MNARQALKHVVEENANLRHYNREASADIKLYNQVIDHMIGGGSPCDYCEDLDECQLQAKGKTGCTDWMLRSRKDGDYASTYDQCGGIEAVNPLGSQNSDVGAAVQEAEDT